MVHRVTFSAVWIITSMAIFCQIQCITLKSIPDCDIKRIKFEKEEKKFQVCQQFNCIKNCTCLSTTKTDSCSQSCETQSLTCPLISCHASDDCTQSVLNASHAPYLYCASKKECQQIITNGTSEKVYASSKSTKQVYRNKGYMLKEMSCASNESKSFCNQSCELCNITSCKTSNCHISCATCGHIHCKGDQICNSSCIKQCNNTVCQSPTCNMVCEAGSTCNSVECRNGVTNCFLACHDGAVCNLNCSTASSCSHTCALDGICHTTGSPGYLDVHNGQCGLCNCTSDVRNCVQRCHSPNGRCLGLYCDANNKCEQFSKSTDSSFVLFMRSTAPIGRQVCDNGSECWHMLCYGSNCSLTCTNKSSCGHMLCRAQECSFYCKNGATCDVITCLPGSRRCKYHCDATANCRVKRCKGDTCVGAPKYIESGASHIRAVFHWHLLFVFLAGYIIAI